MRIAILVVVGMWAVPAAAQRPEALVIVTATGCPEAGRAHVWVLRSLGGSAGPGGFAGRVPCETTDAHPIGSFAVATPAFPCTLGLDIPWDEYWPRGAYVHARLGRWREPAHADFARPDVRAVLEGRLVPDFRAAPLFAIGPIASGPLEWSAEGYGRATLADGRHALVLPTPGDLECVDVPGFFGLMAPAVSSIPSLDGRGCDWASDPALALDGDLRATLRSGFFTVASR